MRLKGAGIRTHAESQLLKRSDNSSIFFALAFESQVGHDLL